MIYGTDRAICVNCDELLPRAAAGRCPICLAAVTRADEPSLICRHCGATSARRGDRDCVFCQPLAPDHLGTNDGKGISS